MDTTRSARKAVGLHPYQVVAAGIDRLTDLRRQWTARGQQEFEGLQKALQKRLQPRTRTKFNPLPEEAVEAFRRQLMAYYGPWIDLIDRWTERLEARRYEAARTVVPTPLPEGRMEAAEESHARTYRTQGWSANKYARGALLPLKARLESLGVTCRIEEDIDSIRTRYGLLSNNTYRLMAGIPRWQSDAIASTITIAEAVQVWGIEHHPKVFLPLSYEHPAIKAWPENVQKKTG